MTIALVASLAAAQTTSAKRIDPPPIAVIESDVEWPRHGLTAGEQRFSPLSQIHANNVSRLRLAWTFDTGLRRGHEATRQRGRGHGLACAVLL